MASDHHSCVSTNGNNMNYQVRKLQNTSIQNINVTCVESTILVHHIHVDFYIVTAQIKRLCSSLGLVKSILPITVEINSVYQSQFGLIESTYITATV